MVKSSHYTPVQDVFLGSPPKKAQLSASAFLKFNATDTSDSIQRGFHVAFNIIQSLVN